ncbi:MAG: hypothetical protein ACKPKO_41440 [Candidatus Fonsibacter sp.]
MRSILNCQIKNAVQIYINERLYDLFVGVPYQFVSNTRKMNYRLKVIYNNSNLISKTVLVSSVPTANTNKSIMYRWLNKYLV